MYDTENYVSYNFNIDADEGELTFARKRHPKLATNIAWDQAAHDLELMQFLTSIYRNFIRTT